MTQLCSNFLQTITGNKKIKTFDKLRKNQLNGALIAFNNNDTNDD
jgi:hypothetical protein